MREKNLEFWQHCTEVEKNTIAEGLAPIPRQVIEEVAALTNYERMVILSGYPKVRDPQKYLLDFIMTVDTTYKPEPCHALICETMDAVTNREIDRVIITAPPQHGKSHICSVNFPAKHIGNRPHDPIIITSYGADLAEDKSKQVRALVESQEYANIFPGIGTRPDSRAVNRWHVNKYRGALLAVGVGGPITGFGTLLGIIDDPFENWKEAQSKGKRDDIWDWYRTTFRTRVWEGGAIVIIMTRWHEDDLIGRIMNDKYSSRWTVLRLPGLSETQAERDRANKLYNLPPGLPDPLLREPGQPLAPQRFSIPTMIDLKHEVGALGWATEYQGAPIAPEGDRIKRSWFSKLVTSVPDGPHVKRVRYWDKAGTDNGGDYTVGVLMAYDTKYEVFYIEDVVRGRWSIGKRDERMYETAEKDYGLYNNRVLIWHEQEPGSGGKDAAALTTKMLNKFPVSHEVATGSKEVRAEPFVRQAEAGNIYLLKAPWNEDYIEEMVAFPNGSHDDQIDATSGAYNKVCLLKEKKKLVSY